MTSAKCICDNCLIHGTAKPLFVCPECDCPTTRHGERDGWCPYCMAWWEKKPGQGLYDFVIQLAEGSSIYAPQARMALELADPKPENWNKKFCDVVSPGPSSPTPSPVPAAGEEGERYDETTGPMEDGR